MIKIFGEVYDRETGGRGMNNEKLDGIKEKIRKNIHMDLLEIQQVFDEESGEFTGDVTASEAYLKGLEMGKLKSYMEIGIRITEVFQEIEKQTGMTFEDLRLLREYGGKDIRDWSVK